MGCPTPTCAYLWSALLPLVLTYGIPYSHLCSHMESPIPPVLTYVAPSSSAYLWSAPLPPVLTYGDDEWNVYLAGPPPGAVGLAVDDVLAGVQAGQLQEEERWDDLQNYFQHPQKKTVFDGALQKQGCQQVLGK